MTAAGHKQVIVIGSGVVGITTALALQDKGFAVTLLDRQQPGKGASFGNAGFLAVELNDPLSTPENLKGAPRLWLQRHGAVALPPNYWHRSLPWLLRFVKAARSEQVERGRRGLSALNREAVGAWRRLIEGTEQHSMLRPSGYLLAWESSNLDDAKRHAEGLEHWQIETHLLQGDGVREYEPGLSDSVHHALLFPDAWQVRDPYQLVLGLYQRFCRQGGTFIETDVRSLNPGSAQVITARGLMQADHVVLCGGAWSHKLLSQTGIDIPLEAERGYHLTLPDAGTALRQPVGSAERRFVMTPMSCGLRVVGFTELGGLDNAAIPRRFDSLRHHAAALLADNAPLKAPHETWMGCRPTLPDSLPVIGRHPAHPRLFAAFGHQHLGLTHAAITAELVTESLSGADTRIDLQPYRMNRF